jgi:EpsI family protein
MKRILFTNLLLGALMLFSAAAAKFMAPTIHMSDSRGSHKLLDVIPVAFGEWKEEKVPSMEIINPQTEARLAELYAETLSRTYINQAGERIMLSIAYGADQRDQHQLHYPEVCYPAQGFIINDVERDIIKTKHGAIAVKRLQTSLGDRRHEPVTYWATVGDIVTTGRVNKKVVEMQYGFKKTIPDGLIFRVSSISANEKEAFAAQNAFVTSLINELDPKNRKRIAGVG